MRNIMRNIAVASLVAGTVLGSPAFAATFVGDYTISAHTAGSGLLVSTTKVGNLTTGFDLTNVGDTKSYAPLFTIRAAESDVGGDDLVPQSISVLFNFTQPGAANGSVEGETVGQTAFFGVFQNGLLTWDNGGVTSFDFGTHGVLQVALDNNVTFSSGLFGLNEKGKGAKIGATFTLLDPASAPVPEPANWAMMIAGFGLVGGAMRARKANTTVSFA